MHVRDDRPTTNRRMFLQAASAAGLWLLAACGRLRPPPQPQPIIRLGLLTPISNPTYQVLPEALRDAGYVDGRNINLVWRSAEGDFTRLPTLAAELVNLPVDLLLVTSTAAAQAAKSATTTIPIVFTFVADPVGSGLVASFAHPGGNLTGLTTLNPELAGKQMELLKEVIPSARRIAVIWNPRNPATVMESPRMGEAAAKLGVELEPLQIREREDLPSVFSMLTTVPPDALFIPGDPLVTGVLGGEIYDFAGYRGIPTMSGALEDVGRRALMVHGASYPAQLRRSVYYIDRILKGTAPADLPVEQPTMFDLVVNLRAAQALGITIPQHVLLQATEIIQ